MHFGDSIFIFLLALVLFGPKRLPEIGRQIGKLMAEFRRASNDFKLQIEDELRASEQQERQQQLSSQVQTTPPAPAELATGTTTELTIQPPSTGEIVSSGYGTGSSPYPDEPPPPDRHYYPPYPTPDPAASAESAATADLDPAPDPVIDATPSQPSAVESFDSAAVSGSAPNVEQSPTVAEQIAAAEIAVSVELTTDPSPLIPAPAEPLHLNGNAEGSAVLTNGATPQNEQASTHHG